MTNPGTEGRLRSPFSHELEPLVREFDRLDRDVVALGLEVSEPLTSSGSRKARAPL